MNWTIEYDNEGYTQWWTVTNGDLEFRSNSEGGSEWLQGILNSFTKVSDEIDRCPRTGFKKDGQGKL